MVLIFFITFWVVLFVSHLKDIFVSHWFLLHKKFFWLVLIIESICVMTLLCLTIVLAFGSSIFLHSSVAFCFLEGEFSEFIQDFRDIELDLLLFGHALQFFHCPIISLLDKNFQIAAAVGEERTSPIRERFEYQSAFEKHYLTAFFAFNINCINSFSAK